MGTATVSLSLDGTVDLPPCDDTTARDAATAAAVEAARAHERIDALPVAAPAEPYDDTAVRDAIANHDERLSTLEAAPAPTATGTAPDPDNAILLDDMPGSTDDAKLDAAWPIAQASNPRRPIRLSARNHTFVKTRTTFSGLRILGPNTGWQNPEISGTSAALPQCNVTLNITGSGYWLTGTGTTYDVTVSGICFKSGNVSSFYHHPYSAGTCYAGHFENLTFYGFKHVFGKPGDAFSMTLCTFRGTWTCVAVQGEQFSLRGSDNFLWTVGEINYGWVGANGGKYLVRFENLTKTAVKHMYLTARGGSRAVLVDGTSSSQGGLDVSDCVIEGQNLNDPAMGALIVVKGGGVSFTNTKLNFGMARPSDFTDQADTALVMVKGGVCVLTNTWTGRANIPAGSAGAGTAVTAPMLEVSGGVAHVERAFGVQPIGTAVQVRKVGGTLVTDSTVQLV